MRLTPLLILPALLYSQSAPVVQDRDKASLEGQVLNSATGEPVRKARLTLRMMVGVRPDVRQPPPSPMPETTMTSDSAGKFLFPNLDPGNYYVTARRDGFAEAVVGFRENGKAELIVLAARDSKTGLIIKMTPYGAIAGRLTDEDGDPIQGQNVALSTYQYTTRGSELVEGNHNATTNDLGEYRIYNVPPGKYFLRAGRGRLQLRDMRDADGDESFAPVFFPGAADVAGAAPIELAAGQQLRDLNLILRKTRLAVIRGRVIAPSGANPDIGLMITSDQGGSSTSGSTTDKDGKFELHGVAPGKVYLIGGYSLGGRRFRTSLPLQIGSADIDGIELRPLPPFDLTGQVRIEGQSSVKLSDIHVTLERPGNSSSTKAREDGSVAFHDVEPFTYRLSAARGSSLYLKSLMWGTVDVTDEEIDLTNGVPAGTEFSVALGADGGQLEGTVKDDRSEPVESAVVTLIPVAPRRTRSYYKLAVTDSLGHFTIGGIGPGSYKIYAWDNVNTNAVIYDPDFLRPYEGAAQNVEVYSNEKKSVDLKLTVNKPQ